MQVIALSAFLLAVKEQAPHPRCPVRALRFWQSEQLFVNFEGHTKGQPVSKQRIYRWIVDAIALAYKSVDLLCPLRVRAHSSCLFLGVASRTSIIGWSLTSTFISTTWTSLLFKHRCCQSKMFVYCELWAQSEPLLMQLIIGRSTEQPRKKDYAAQQVLLAAQLKDSDAMAFLSNLYRQSTH